MSEIDALVEHIREGSLPLSNHQLGALTQLAERAKAAERERDSLLKQALAQGAWMEGAMPSFSEVAGARAHAEVAEARVRELEEVIRHVLYNGKVGKQSRERLRLVLKEHVDA